MTPHPDDPSPRAYRFPAGLPAEITDSDATYGCVAENLSRTGALLVGPIPPPSQDLVDLTLKTPGGAFQARFRVHPIRVDPDPGQDGLRIAVEFAPLDDAQRHALEVLIARFLDGRTPPSLPELRPGATALEVRRALDAIPLAQRMALAAHGGVKEREILRQDQNAPVIEALIRNPNLMLAEARALAAAPLLPPLAVDALAADPRFAKDDEVRIALASHPRASLGTAERIAAELKPPQIRSLLARPTLHPALRKKLVARLASG